MWALRGTSADHRAIFDLLLDSGADIHLQNQVLALSSSSSDPPQEGNTVLHKAMQLGYAAVVTKLCAKGADPAVVNLVLTSSVLSLS
jgi:ankyrin repeat protein